MRNRIILAAIIVTLAGLAFYTGLFKHLTPDHLGEIADSAGAFGPVIIIVLFTVLEPFAVPGAIFMLAASALYPFWLAFIVNWLGSIGAGMFGFAFARYFARDWVSGRMPERLRKWDDRLSNEGLRVVIIFRAMFFLNPASHWALGLSQVRAPQAALGTAIGFLPWIIMWSYFGERILNWFDTNSTGMIIGVGLAIAAAIAVSIVIRRRREAAADPTASA